MHLVGGEEEDTLICHHLSPLAAFLGLAVRCVHVLF